MRGQLCSYTVWPASQCRRRKSANKGFRGEAERVSPITPLLQIRGKLILAQAIENLSFAPGATSGSLKRRPLASFPVASPGMFAPSVVLAFLPAPIVRMDDHAGPQADRCSPREYASNRRRRCRQYARMRLGKRSLIALPSRPVWLLVSSRYSSLSSVVSIELHERDRRWKVPPIVSQAVSQARSRICLRYSRG
jgi:hypothetical protein